MTAVSLSEFQSRLADVVGVIADRYEADVVLLNQPITQPVAAKFHALLESVPEKHKTVFLILTTYGGDPHAAYLIARDLQLRYDKVVLCIGGDCYSAGTLIVFVANELVVADRGRLGPLDIQILKRDELAEWSSGLNVGIALEELRRQGFETFVFFVEKLKDKFGIQLTLRTALETASALTTEVYKEVYKQIDPIKLAEDARALQIMGHYGTLLQQKSGNLKPGAIEKLLKEYPSHECIIDRTEACELFSNVREPDRDELKLLQVLGEGAARGGQSLMAILSQLKRKDDARESKDIEGAPSKRERKRGANGKPGDSRDTAGGNGAARKGEPAATTG